MAPATQLDEQLDPGPGRPPSPAYQRALQLLTGAGGVAPAAKPPGFALPADIPARPDVLPLIRAPRPPTIGPSAEPAGLAEYISRLGAARQQLENYLGPAADIAEGLTRGGATALKAVAPPGTESVMEPAARMSRFLERVGSAPTRPASEEPLAAVGRFAGEVAPTLPLFALPEAAAEPLATTLTESLLARGAGPRLARAAAGGVRGALVAGGGSAAQAAIEHPDDPLTAAAVAGYQGATMFGPIGAVAGAIAPVHVQLEGAMQARQFQVNEAAKAAAAAMAPPAEGPVPSAPTAEAAPAAPIAPPGAGPTIPEGETGGVSSRLLPPLVGAGAGALVGAATAEPDQRDRGAALGAAAGLMAGGAGGAGLSTEEVPGMAGAGKAAELAQRTAAIEQASKHLNLEKFPEEIRGHLAATVNRLVESGELKKEPMTWSEQRTAAAKLLMNPDDLSPDKVKRLDAPEMLALGNLVVDNERRLIDLQSRITDPNASPADLEAHTKAIAELERVNEKATAMVASTRSEKGRMLNSLKQELDGLLNPALPLEDKIGAWLVKAKQMVGDRPLSADELGKLRELVSAWHQTGDEPSAAVARRALIDYTASLRALTIPEAIGKMFVANVISSPAVFAKASGGALSWHVLLSVPERTVGAGVDWAIGNLWTGQRSMTRPTLDQMTAAAGGARVGVVNKVRELLGKPVTDPRGPDWAQVEIERRVDPTGRNLIGRGTASVLNTYNHWVSANVTGLHGIYFNAIARAAQEGALRELADLQAARELPNGSAGERNALALTFYKDPTKMPGAEAIAMEAGLEASLRNHGFTVRGIQTMRGWLRREGGVAPLAGTTTVPVANVPANAFENFLKRIPGVGQLGLLKSVPELARAVNAADPALIRLAQRKVALNLARGVTGSAGLLGLGAWMASKGLATGRIPNDPKTARQWAQEGKTPYSVRIGDTWHNVGVFAPAGMIFAFGADLHRAFTEAIDAKGNLMTGPQRFADALMTPAKMMLDLPFLEQPKRIMEAATSGRGGPALVAGTAAMAIPLESAVRRLARYVDPINRAPEGFIQEWETVIPGLSKQVPPAISPVTGEPTTHVRGFLSNMIDPTSPREAQDELVQREAARFGVVLSKPVQSPTETQDQYVERQQRLGRRVNEHLRMLFNSPGWQAQVRLVDAGPPAKQAERYLAMQSTINDLVNDARGSVTDELRARGQYTFPHAAAVEKARRLLEGRAAEAAPAPEPAPAPAPVAEEPRPAPKRVTRVSVTKRDANGRAAEYEFAHAGD